MSVLHAWLSRTLPIRMATFPVEKGRIRSDHLVVYAALASLPVQQNIDSALPSHLVQADHVLRIAHHRRVVFATAVEDLLLRVYPLLFFIDSGVQKADLLPGRAMQIFSEALNVGL